MKYERNIPLGESGIIYVCPPAPPKEKIDGYNLPKKDQKFRRQKFLSDSEFLLLDKEKRIEILSTELDRRLNGYFLMINGCLTYLTGSHYFYLNYWDMGAQTEDGFPEYRWSNTKWFYFKDFCIKDPNCFGGIMLTQKRFGKTEIEIADLYNAATLIDTKCLFGMQSINATDARKNLFQDRLMRSHKAIPNYLKPISNETKSTKPIVSELTFFGNKEGGKYTAALDNKIDWRPTTVSAYQGKKPKRIFIDEPGTIDEMDLEEAWTTIREQLALGKKINGKAFLPTTLENMTNKGAFAFKEIWDKSDYNKRDENGRTASGFYRYFKPFYEGYEGFIDEYGNDLVDEAKKFRQNKLDAASEADQRKTKRQYPETQNEAFDVMTSTFFANRVVEKYKVIWDEIKNNKEDRASIVIIGDKIELKPNDKSPFVFLELPKPNVDYYLLVDGVGTGTESGGEEGSDVAGIIVKMYDPATGLPFEFVAYFRKRPQTVEQSYEYLLDLCKYYNIHGRFKKIQAEASNSTADHLPDFLRRNNLIQWAMRRRDYSGKGYVEVDKYFQPVNQWSMSYALREMNMLLDKYPNSVRMKGIVSDFLLPSDKNADLRSAALMLPFVLPPNFDKPQQQIQPIIRRRYEIVNKNGTNVRVVTSKVYYPKGYIPPVQE